MGLVQQPASNISRVVWTARERRWIVAVDARDPGALTTNMVRIGHSGKTGYVTTRINSLSGHFHVHRYAYNHQLTPFQLHPYHNVDTVGPLARC